ncbi:MAG TPA: ATP-binding cassette domain-containing protein, partial [Agromyces sp.]|nr:ATP-binding cassette domain-containing protein [Agromyces sp.]
GDRQRRRLERASNALNAETSRVLRKAFLSGFVMDAVVTFAIAVCATTVGFELLGYVQIPGTAPLTLGAGLFVLILCPMYFLPIRQIASGYHDRDRAMAAAEVLGGLVPTAAGPDSPGARRTDATGAAASGGVKSAMSVRVRDLTCRFDPEGRSVLESVTLDLPARSWTAVTGPTGSGKTTLLSMIAGLGRPTSGTVAWQDPSNRAVISPNIEAVSWLGQRSVVLEGTIAENIRFGDPHASDSAVRAAADTAGLLAFVDSLPAGMETMIGDDGWGLSAGQTRRIAIARAVLRDTGLWILDEPTAHLDPVTELAVLRALRRAASDRTVVIATHSAAVLAVVDQQVDLATTSTLMTERGVSV